MASSSSRFYHQLTSSFLLLHRTRKLNININNKISFSSHFSPSSSSSSSIFVKSISSNSLRFYNSTSGSSSVAVVSADDDAAAIPSSNPTPAAAHPWPEWDQFVEKMRSKGYFAKTAAEADASSDVSSSSSSYSSSSMELNRIKNACLSFARERFDVIGSLPKEDIQTIVECGCPNLFRKAVNSAKRLRAFLKLDEGDVCSACKLRGSCDRAYVIEKDEVKPRTVDIMRIIMNYAVDPALRSGGLNPSITENVQESARKLLGELIKLSDTGIDPTLLKPEVNPPRKKELSKTSQKVTSKSRQSENVQKVTSKSRQSENVEMKRGDWMCSKCNFLNFARNTRCLECKADGPKRVDFSNAEMKLGDWTCPKCEFMNFSRNRKCFRCQESRPKRQLNPGEWECPKCDFLNFKRNAICKRCDREHPANEEANGFEGHLWRSPRAAKEGRVLNFGDGEDEQEDPDFDDELDNMLPIRDKKNNFLASKRATRGGSRPTGGQLAITLQQQS